MTEEKEKLKIKVKNGSNRKIKKETYTKLRKI